MTYRTALLKEVYLLLHQNYKMKNIIHFRFNSNTTLIIVFSVLFIFQSNHNIQAQSSNSGIIFQALARDSYQNPAITKNVYIQSNIIQGSKTGLIVYSEEHNTTTDATGVFSVSVGMGNRIGGTKSNLPDIDWSNGPYFLNMKISIPSTNDLLTARNWVDLGTTIFGVVPYALNIIGASKTNSFDTSSFNLKLNIADTSLMLSKRIARDTINLSKRIIEKLNTSDSVYGYVTKYQLMSKTIDLSPIYSKLDAKMSFSDTASMLFNYTRLSDLSNYLDFKLNKSDTAAMFNARFGRDTISLSNRINLKVNISDLSNSLLTKVNITDLENVLYNKVDKVTGKSLSTNDFTNAEKLKLATITGTNTGDQDLSGYVTISALALKANTIDVNTSLATKVDKVTGRNLSTNDYTTIEKNKLASITGINTGDQDLSSYATLVNIALKANTADLNAGFLLKANISDVEAGLALKANTADLNAGLLLKANTSDVEASLALKANITDITTLLLSKENTTNKSIDINLGGIASNDNFYPTQKAVKSYVDGQISAGGISDGSILTRHIANSNITSALIADASITDAKIAMGINKSKVGLGNVENIALNTWGGSSQITTLGTVSSGIWSGTTIAINNGGTGATNATDARDNLGLAIGRDVQSVLTVIQAAVLSNTSGFNSGDETSASIKSKLGITTLSGINTGDQDLSSYATTTNLALKANTSDVTSSLALKANSSDLTSGLLLKANASDVTTSLATKANSSDLTSGLLLKANASDVTTSLATKVDKVTGKDLSTNDYTTTEKTKLSAISGTNTGDQDLSSYATTTNLALKANASDVTTSLALKANSSDLTSGLLLKANASDVTTSLALKANSSDLTSGLLLKANVSDVTTSLATKANSSDLTSGLLLKANASDVTTSLATKVDKVTGKDLSTNDYTTTEKTKLSAISGTNTGDQDLSSYATTTNLALKANTSDVTSSLLLKANASDVTTSLALKANLISPTLVTPTLGVATATSILSGTITSTADIIAKRYKLTMPTAITATANTTIDLSTGNMFTINLGITPSNFDVSNAGVGTYLIKFVQDATGSRDVIFPTAWKWSGGIAPNLTNTAGKLDIVTLIYDGSTYYATIVSNF